MSSTIFASACALSLCAFAFQQEPGRDLPEDRTLLQLDVAPLDRLAAHRARIFQLAILDLPEVVDTLERIATWEPGFGKTLERAPLLGRYLRAFDQGMTVATVFGRAPAPRDPSRPFPAPWCLLIGQARESAALREHRDLWKRITASAERQDGTESPFFEGYRGRRAALMFWEALERSPAPRAAVSLAAEILGITTPEPHQPRVRVIPPHPREGFETLARWRYRPRALWTAGEDPEPGGDDEMASLALALSGARVFREIVGVLGTDGKEVDERIVVRTVPGTRSVLDALRASEEGLAEIATRLPADTIAALRIGLRGEVVSDLIYDFFEHHGSLADAKRLVGRLRVEIGLDDDPAAGDRQPGLAGLDEITYVLLPGAAGSPLLEVLFLVPAREGMTPERLVDNVARSLAAGKGASSVRVRRLGEGPEAIPYVSRRTVHGDPFQAFAMRLFGQSHFHFAATRVGDRLAFGACSPRVLRRVRDTGRNSLAARPGFRGRFPAGKRTSLELWVDTGALADNLRRFYDLFLFPLARMAGIELPRFRDLRPLLATETAWIEPTRDGHRIVHRGGTILSPTAWIATGYAAHMLGVLSESLSAR